MMAKQPKPSAIVIWFAIITIMSAIVTALLG